LSEEFSLKDSLTKKASFNLPF